MMDANGPGESSKYHCPHVALEALKIPSATCAVLYMPRVRPRAPRVRPLSQTTLRSPGLRRFQFALFRDVASPGRVLKEDMTSLDDNGLFQSLRYAGVMFSPDSSLTDPPSHSDVHTNTFFCVVSFSACRLLFTSGDLFTSLYTSDFVL